MKNNRNNSIDFLRGLAVLLMVLIHATAYFLKNKIALFIWDYSHFAVPLFVFCSAYIYFQKDNEGIFSFQYFIKRLKRLIIPYYIFLVFYLLILFFTSPHKVNPSFVVSQFMLGSSRDVGWLVVLFIYIVLILPIIKLFSKNKIAFLLAFLISVGSALFLLFYSVKIPFRLTMWLPWTSFLIFTYLIKKNSDSKYFPILIIGFSLITFLLAKYYLTLSGKSLIFTDNKYPPNYYYLSYGFFFTSVLYYFYEFLERKNFIADSLKRIFYFISVHSYSLFFIHFLYIYLIVGLGYQKNLNWWSYFAVVLVLTTVTQLIINALKK